MSDKSHFFLSIVSALFPAFCYLLVQFHIEQQILL